MVVVVLHGTTQMPFVHSLCFFRVIGLSTNALLAIAIFACYFTASVEVCCYCFLAQELSVYGLRLLRRFIEMENQDTEDPALDWEEWDDWEDVSEHLGEFNYVKAEICSCWFSVI